MLKEGSKPPGFCLSSSFGKKTCLEDYAGRWLVLFFYSKDDTGG
jgi:thioredoxin-dependent peroxiredoxin